MAILTTFGGAGASAANGRRRQRCGAVAKSGHRRRNPRRVPAGLSCNALGEGFAVIRKRASSTFHFSFAGFRRMSRRFVARRSPIHGNGVFATAPIGKGEEIIEYRGKLMTHAHADDLYGDGGEKIGRAVV